MKNRVLIISLAVVAVAAVVAAIVVGLSGRGSTGPTGPTAPTKIIIGAARDTDEALAFFECNAGGPVMRWYVNKVNSEGGIHLSYYDTATTTCMVPVELIEREFSVASWDIGTATQGLITNDKASFIFGGPSTDSLHTQAPICNANAILLFTLEGGASSLIWDHDIDGWPYVWVNLSFSNWYEVPVLAHMLDEKLGHNATVYCTYIGGAGAQHGLEYLTETKSDFGVGNVIDAGAHSFVMDSTEANTIIQTAKAALNTTPYDIFCAYTYPWNVAALTQACIANKFNPPAILFGPGGNFGSYSVDWGGNTTGIMSWTMANTKTVPKVGTPTMSMADMFTAIAGQIEKDWTTYTPCPQPPGVTNGTQLLDFWGFPCYTAAMEMWQYAVEDVGKIDEVAIRNALASYNSTNPAKTVFGDTWYHVFGDGFGGGMLDYMCHTGEVGQWQNGVFETVGTADINTAAWAAPPYGGAATPLPNYDVTANFTYPMTNLWGWLP